MFMAAGKVSFRRAESTALCVKESWTDEGRGSSEYVKISERFLVWRGDNNKHPQTAEETWKTEKKYVTGAPDNDKNRTTLVASMQPAAGGYVPCSPAPCSCMSPSGSSQYPRLFKQGAQEQVQ